MKKEERSPFANNLRQAREAKGWIQHKAADLLGIPRTTYGSYEEGRALPSIKVLRTILHIYGITNILSFLENPDFNYQDQDKQFTIEYQSPLEKIYANASERNRKIVDAALGIGVEEITC